MSTTFQKLVARKFVEQWTFRRGSEKGEDQQFWNSLLGEILGMEDVTSCVQYQVPVPVKDTTKFLDAWIPATRVLIEHKSRGVNLDMPQSGHDGLTPYEQAVEYDNARPPSRSLACRSLRPAYDAARSPRGTRDEQPRRRWPPTASRPTRPNPKSSRTSSVFTQKRRRNKGLSSR